MGRVFIERRFRRDNNSLILFSILCKMFSVSAVINLFLFRSFKTVI